MAHFELLQQAYSVLYSICLLGVHSNDHLGAYHSSILTTKV